MIIQDVTHWLEAYAPPVLAETWDHIGLQVGNPHTLVRKVLLTLDVTTETVHKAVQKKADLIIAHHPFIFDPITKLDTQEPKTKIIAELLQNNISVYIAHTNLDAAWPGVSDALADQVGIDKKSRLVITPTHQVKLYKLAVFIPVAHVDTVREAISVAGAGQIGNYRHCTFATPGMGTFMSLTGTKPFIGKLGQLTLVDEVRLETIVPEFKLSSVLAAMLNAHPYEEVAYDLYPVEQTGTVYGIGRMGELRKPVLLSALAQSVGGEIIVKAKRANSRVQRIAVLGGACGRKDIYNALALQADVLVTGELKYHDQLEAQETGLPVIAMGHRASEVCVLPVLRKALQIAFKVNCDVI